MIIRIKIKNGWDQAGRMGRIICFPLQPNYLNMQTWTGVMWDDEDDPDWIKTDSIEILSGEQEVKDE